MSTLYDQNTVNALPPFCEREKTSPPREMSAAELASFKAEVQRIAAMLGELNSPAAMIAARLGLSNPGKGVVSAPAESRAAASLGGASSVKRPSTFSPSTPTSTKSWVMRRVS